MNKYLIYLFVMIFLGCNRGNRNVENLILDEVNKKYDYAISFFGKTMTDHFPNRIVNKSSSFTDSYSSELGNLELVLLYKEEKNFLTDFQKDYEQKAIAKYEASDSCLLVVNKFVSRNHHFRIQPTQRELQFVENDCYSNLYPIPNFWHNVYTTDSTLCRLPKDFNVYVIDAKRGKYFEQYLSNAWFMPEKWKHGYSKGVAISEKRHAIIYWLVIW